LYLKPVIHPIIPLYSTVEKTMSLTPRLLVLASLTLPGCFVITSTSSLQPSAGDAFNRARAAAKKKKAKDESAQQDKAAEQEKAEAKEASERSSTEPAASPSPPAPAQPAERARPAPAPAESKPAFVRVDPGEIGGPLAEAYTGKVVFSTQPIPWTGADGSSIIESYALDGPLYARFWSADSIHNLVEGCIGRPTVYVRASVNDGEEFPVTDFMPKTRVYVAMAITEELSTSLATPTQVGDRAADEAVRRWNGRIVPLLEVGDNTVRLELQTSCQGTKTVTLAEGTLRVTVTAAARAAYIKKYGPHLPRSTHPDAAVIVPGIRAALADKWQNTEVVGAVAIGKSWDIKRHAASGVPLYRHGTAVVVGRKKDESNPEVCEAHFVGVRQEASGSGFERHIRYNGVGVGGPHHIPCSVARR